jgi:hypothetical protein
MGVINVTERGAHESAPSILLLAQPSSSSASDGFASPACLDSLVRRPLRRPLIGLELGFASLSSKS